MQMEIRVHLCTSDAIKVTTHLPINTSIYSIPGRDAVINFKKN